MNAADHVHPAATSLRADEPMTDELCLFVLSLVMDGRSVAEPLVTRARAHAELHRGCAVAWADFRRLHEVLSSEPSRNTTAGFTERVLAAWRSRADVLPAIRRLAAAAAVVLALTLAFDTIHPTPAVGDESLPAQHYVIEHFKPSPYEPDDLDAGLEALLSGRAEHPPGRWGER